MYDFITRVRYSELEEDRKAGLVSLINYFQDCCTFEAEDGGIGLDWLAERSAAWMLTSWHIHILRRPKYCEHIRVYTWACGFRRFLGKREFEIRNSGTGELLVHAASDWAYVDTETGHPKETPAREVEVYGLKDPVYPELAKGRLRVPEAPMTEKPSITVTEANLDTNHHVNNAQYVALAMCALPENLHTGKITDFRARLMAQSVKGDVLIPYLLEEDGRYTVLLRGEDGSERLIAEFSLENAG